MNAHKPDAILFDLDGTIVDWQTGMDQHWREACAAACRDGAPSPDALYDAIVRRRTWFWDDAERARTGRMDLLGASQRIVEHALDDLRAGASGMAAALAADYRSRREAALAPYPGAVETLDRLRADGRRLALITNGNAVAQRRTIERFGLARHFECIVIEGEFGCGKPDERCFRHALDALSCDARSAWMVGDSLEADIATPYRMGLHTVWVDATGTGVPAASVVRPHRIVGTIAELAVLE